MSDATEQIDAYLAGQVSWQRANLEVLRALIHAVAPTIEEAWKWGVPVFLANNKLVCAMSTFKDHTKYNFFEGAALLDPHGLFNSGLESKRSRAIDLREGEQLDAAALRELLTQAIAKSEK